MELQETEIRCMLKGFGISERLLQHQVLVDIDCVQCGQHIVKHYEKISSENDEYLLKVLLLPMRTVNEIEQEALIGERFRAAGLITPKHYPVAEDGGKEAFGLKYMHKDEVYLVLVEEFAGEGLTFDTPGLVRILGDTLGQIHRIAEDGAYSMRTGFFAGEFSRGRTDYLPLWRQCGTDFLPQQLLAEVVSAYGSAMERMKLAMAELPRYTVQGDIYYLNFTERQGKIYVIDFDHAGDEVLAADLVITWCRYWFDPRRDVFTQSDTEGRIKTYHREWKAYLAAYEKYRKLTDEEQESLAAFQGVLGATYGTKLLATAAMSGARQKAADGLEDIYAILHE